MLAGETLDFVAELTPHADAFAGYVALDATIAPHHAASAGAWDPTFGTGGKVTTAFNFHQAPGFGAALGSDGKIVVVGGPQFNLARYNSDGSLDTTFGTSGKVLTDFGGDTEATGVTIQADGKIVVVGFKNFNGVQVDFALARYNRDGSLDTTFGTGGKVITDFQSHVAEAAAVTLQHDGKLVVAGKALNGAGGGGNFDFALARYNPDGSLDSSFGSGGELVTDFGTVNNEA